MCGFALEERDVKNLERRKLLELEPVILTKGRLRWFGHDDESGIVW